MLNTSYLVCFTATSKSDASKVFYQDVLGLTLIEDNPIAIVFDVNGVMLRIQKVANHVPLHCTAVGWHVQHIKSVIDELTKKGIQFERFHGMDQDERGIWKAPSGAKIAWFKDPDGNILSLTEW